DPDELLFGEAVRLTEVGASRPPYPRRRGLVPLRVGRRGTRPAAHETVGRRGTRAAACLTACRRACFLGFFLGVGQGVFGRLDRFIRCLWQLPRQERPVVLRGVHFIANTTSARVRQGCGARRPDFAFWTWLESHTNCKSLKSCTTVFRFGADD